MMKPNAPQDVQKMIREAGNVPRIYVAGPYRSTYPWEREQNARRAELYGFMLAQCGAMPEIPHANTRHYFEGVQDDEFWLRGAIRKMMGCDAVAMMPGWSKSSGASLERRVAAALEFRIFEPVCENMPASDQCGLAMDRMRFGEIGRWIHNYRKTWAEYAGPLEDSCRHLVEP
jgi:hypothetical protein